MNVDEYNKLCLQWHNEETGQRLGQWLMNHLPEESDSEIFYSQDKSTAAALFFRRYVVTSPNGIPKDTPTNNFIHHQSY